MNSPILLTGLRGDLLRFAGDDRLAHSIGHLIRVGTRRKPIHRNIAFGGIAEQLETVIPGDAQGFEPCMILLVLVDKIFPTKRLQDVDGLEACGAARCQGSGIDLIASPTQIDRLHLGGLIGRHVVGGEDTAVVLERLGDLLADLASVERLD